MRISIIVPVFNAGKTLCRCVDSVLNQTFTNWELILIDDGSTDESGAVCDNYVNRDKRIKAIHKLNGGVSSARNMGLDNASGDHICFIDADDYIDAEYLDSLAKSFADMVVCGFRSSEGITYKPIARYLDAVRIGLELQNLIVNDYSLFVPWIKLFKHDIIENNNIRFDTKLKLSEDTMFVYDYLSCCSNIEYISNTAYYYEGIFGGGSKYKLSWNEMVYMHESEIIRRQKLLLSFPNSSDITTSVCPRISRTERLLEDHTMTECYSIWEKYITNKRYKQEFFYSNVFSISKFIVMYLTSNKIDSKLVDRLNQFLDIDRKYINPSGALDKLICRLLLANNVYGLKLTISMRKLLKSIKIWIEQ